MRTQAEIEEKLKQLVAQADGGKYPVLLAMSDCLKWVLGIGPDYIYIPKPYMAMVKATPPDVKKEENIADLTSAIATAAWNAARNETSMQDAAKKWSELVVAALYQKLDQR